MKDLEIRRMASRDIPEIVAAFELHYRDHHVKYFEEITVDDDLALYFTKRLKQG